MNIRSLLDQANFSIYKNTSAREDKIIFTHTGTDTLEGFIANCISGGGVSDLFEKILTEPDENQQKAMKARLPAYTISATYNPGRKIQENLVCHTGMICMDLDQHDNPAVEDWSKVRDLIFDSWEEVVCCALSARGKGVFVMICLEGATPENHGDFFTALATAFRKTGFVVDKKCADIGRLRFLTWDPKLKYRATPKAFKLPPPLPKARSMSNRTNRPRYRKGSKADVFTAAVRYAQNKWGPFTDGNKHMFIASVSTTLKNAGIALHERESFIYNNLIDKSQVKTNCVNMKP